MQVNPKSNCNLCPRLVDFRKANQKKFTDFHNGPVESFGEFDSRLLIVGLAPGLKGANKTGRPFTGDYAGDVLYSTLIKFGFAKGLYSQSKDDGLKLLDCRITNAVRCVPPENKPIGSEVKSCRSFLNSEIKSMVNLQAILALGVTAHNSLLACLKLSLKDYAFKHSVIHKVSNDNRSFKLIDSYHCSRYNINTKRLSVEMFEDVFESITKLLSSTE